MRTTPAFDLLQSTFPGALRIGTADLARVLGKHPVTIRVKAKAGTLGLRTYIDQKDRFADLRDVADYLDSMREVKRVGRPTKASKIAAQLSAAQ